MSSKPAPEQIARIRNPQPFGDVTLVPSEVTGLPQAELAKAMAEVLLETAPATGAEALQKLRAAFPAAPLTTRVAALAALVRR
jgi:hypothetical protein